MLARGDLLVLLFIIVIIGISFTLTAPGIFPEQEREVVVTVNGEEVLRHQLDSKDAEMVKSFAFDVDGEQHTGHLEIDGHRVRLQRLPEEIVPLPIHVNMGWIEGPNQAIVSVPVRLLVNIEGREHSERDPGPREVDAVVGNF